MKKNKFCIICHRVLLHPNYCHSCKQRIKNEPEKSQEATKQKVSI